MKHWARVAGRRAVLGLLAYAFAGLLAAIAVGIGCVWWIDSLAGRFSSVPEEITYLDDDDLNAVVHGIRSFGAIGVISDVHADRGWTDDEAAEMVRRQHRAVARSVPRWVEVVPPVDATPRVSYTSRTSAWGWPVYMARGGAVVHRGELDKFTELDDVPADIGKLQFGPIWSGVAINTALWGGVIWLVWNGTTKWLLRWVRARRGRCPGCGYALQGLEPGAGCPECGRSR